MHYVDLPVYGTAMSLAWKKHRMRCPHDPLFDEELGAERSPDRGQELLVDHQGGQVGHQAGRRGAGTVSEVAAELSCDWHTVNDAVITYGEALLGADRKRLNQTSAIGLDETSFVRLGAMKQTSYATTVADVANHQIIDILPTRKYVDVAGWIDAQPASWERADPLRCPRHVERLCGGLHRHLAQGRPGGRPLPPRSVGQPQPRRRAAPGAKRTDRTPGSKRRSPLPGPPGAVAGRGTPRRKSRSSPGLVARLGRSGRRGGHRLPHQRAAP